jgi:putative spermidine/putrescine transport system permease protein
MAGHMAVSAQATQGAQLRPAFSHSLRQARDWLGVVPFLLFALMFLFAPAFSIAVGSFQDNTSGSFTLQHIFDLSRPAIVSAYWVSIRISAATAMLGLLFGFLLSYAVTIGGLPRSARAALLTFCGVASNFAGVPLAFAFIATIGRLGVITLLLKNVFGIDLYSAGFSLYTFLGLCIVYLYFQLPLTVLILTPALDGLRQTWREACESLGGTTWDYWRNIALPILTPALLGVLLLLFGNAFGAYATAYALTSGQINLVTMVIGQQISGDALHDPGLGNALALGMVVVMVVCITAYTLLQRRASRWLRS